MSNEEIPNGFKTTELGPLPEEWEVVRLGEVAEYINGYAFKPIQWKKRGLPIIRIQNLTRSTDEINYYDEELEERYKIRNGDLLISWSASLGVFKWSGSDAWLNQHIFKVDNYSPNIWKDYLHYVVMTKIESMKSKTHGSTMHHITKKEFLAVEIPLPPLHEQRAIASVLSAVHEAKEKTEAVITATKELKKSMMKHLFTYGPVSVEEAENVPLKETEIGLVPEEWDVVMLGDVVKKTEQKDPRKTPECQFKYIDVSSINREDLKIVEYKLYKGKDAPSRAKKLAKSNDVIFATVRPTLRRFTLIEEDLNGEICSTAFCVLRAKESFLSSLYVLYVVQRDIFIDELRKIQRGVSYPAVTNSDVKNQKIPLPPLPEQQQIAHILSTVDKKIEIEKRRKTTFKELFKTMLHKLMSGEMRLKEVEI